MGLIDIEFHGESFRRKKYEKIVMLWRGLVIANSKKVMLEMGLIDVEFHGVPLPAMSNKQVPFPAMTN